MFISTNKETLFRDLNSKAIIIKDPKGKSEFQRNKEERERLQKEINSLRDDIVELKQMISQIINKG